MTETATSMECPYIGLAPYSETQRDYFFGRQTDSQLIADTILTRSLTVLYGKSGVGKSSILSAGVPPLLRETDDTESEYPRVLIWREWQSLKFLDLMARKLAAESDAHSPLNSQDNPDIYEIAIRLTGERESPVVLIFDQFEEYFAYTSPQRETFEQQLAKIVNWRVPNVHVLFALRDDGLSRLDQMRRRIPDVLQHRFELKHLREADAKRAIRCPIDVFNKKNGTSIKIQQELVDELLIQAASTHPGSGKVIETAYLQLALREIWDTKRPKGSEELRRETLQGLGESGSIARRHLDRVIGRLRPREVVICASLFDRMVTPKGGKIAMSGAALAQYAKQDEADVSALLRRLAQEENRLVRSVPAPDNPDVDGFEIYHDILGEPIRDWLVEKEEARAVKFATRQLRRWLRVASSVATFMVLLVVGYIGWSLLAHRSSFVPQNTPVTEARWLDQNWSPKARYWFHHATQGAATLPVSYDWFIALEQPEIWFFGDPPMLADSDYLRRFGFIPSPRTLELEAPALKSYGYVAENGAAGPGRAFAYDEAKFPGNPDGLPVGFARLANARDPRSGAPLPDQIGFTCAACHTGHLEYNGVSLRIDGAPAVIDLGKFREALGLALVTTKTVPFRFGRFAERVLGPGHTEAQRAELKARLDALITIGKAHKKITDPVFNQNVATGLKGNVEEGFARLDALNRMGNQVFFSELFVSGGDNETAISNLAPITAPVNYPHIWGTSWFLWGLYDASIMQPMVRHVGKTLSVGARVNLIKPGRGLYRSTVELGEIFDLEQLLAGPNPFGGDDEPEFKGLRAPVWPADLLGPIDTGRRDRGRVLYAEYCQGCHLPAVRDRAFWDGAHWTKPNGAGERYLKLTEKPVSHVGTDPAQAKVVAERRVKVPAHLEIESAKICKDQAVDPDPLFAVALGVVVEKTTEKWYDDHKVSKPERDRMNGYRPNCLQAEMIYKARPLDGIWATAPYLHNGSVPNLYELLSPVDERSETFYLGSRLFDPEKVGYRTEKIAGGFELDTRLAGNSNKGHEFRDGPRAKGVLGPALSHEQRMDLIEYLKTL